jgi:ParB-like chromosome segregation protein Spo0J
MKTTRIMLDGIETGKRLRAIDPANVQRIAASIKEIGLQTPLTVLSRPDGADTRMILVAGAHRLEALRQLGEDVADCIVLDDDEDFAALWEIDENFARVELTPLQRADHHARREEILKRKGLVSAGPGQPKKNSDKLSAYSARAAADLGVDERTVRRDLRRAKGIAEDIRSQITGTDLDTGEIADRLVAAGKDNQRATLDAIRQERARAAVRPAPDPLNDPEAHERQLAALMAAWNRAAAVVRQEFLLRIEGVVFDATSAGRAA